MTGATLTAPVPSTGDGGCEAHAHRMRNATTLLVRTGSLNDDEACKLFRALRVTAVKFGLELASQSTARRDAKEAPDARTALRKRWVGVERR